MLITETKLTNIINKYRGNEMSYTLQNSITGKYISSLFSDSIYESFRANRTDDAYVWNNESNAGRVAAEFNLGVGHVLQGLEIVDRKHVIKVVEIN